jgi:hypothetical protein
MLACAAAATRNDDGSIGSSPVRVTLASADGAPPAALQIALRISLGLAMIPRVAEVVVSRFCWHQP